MPETMIMHPKKLDLLIAHLAENTTPNVADLSLEELGWIFDHFEEIYEWVTNERRIAAIKGVLLDSLTRKR